ncbi:MAG: hypothetical protein ACUVQZ_08475 [Candidatus Caldatribacteriaceae bacterium]
MQNQTPSVLLFLYHESLHQDLKSMDALCIQKLKHLPTILTKEEVHRVVTQMSDTQHLMIQPLYDASLHLIKCIHLRTKDVNFKYRTIAVRYGKVKKDQVTILPVSLITLLQEYLQPICRHHLLENGYDIFTAQEPLSHKALILS